MTGPNGDFERRLAAAEENARVARTLAAAVDRDVSVLAAQRKADLRLLQALRDTQIEHSRRFDRLESEMREGFAEVRRGFATMQVGMSQIVALLERDTGD